MSTIPFFFALRAAGVEVFISNLTFTDPAVLLNSDAKRFYGAKDVPICVEITADTKFPMASKPSIAAYFPELDLTRWFRESEKLEVPIYTFIGTGVKPMRAAYGELVAHLNVDTIVLCDGGTDSLMFGDEQQLGTPTEDALSMAAVYGLTDARVRTKLLLNLGMGVDTYHGVSHGRWLQNVAAVGAAGGYLGAFSATREMVGVQKMLAAHNACRPQLSIVCSSVVTAFDHKFGNTHHSAAVNRTRGSQLFINPLMAMYFCFRLDTVCELNKYMATIHDTTKLADIRHAINAYRAANNIEQNVPRPHIPIAM